MHVIVKCRIIKKKLTCLTNCLLILVIHLWVCYYIILTCHISNLYGLTGRGSEHLTEFLHVKRQICDNLFSEQSVDKCCDYVRARTVSTEGFITMVPLYLVTYTDELKWFWHRLQFSRNCEVYFLYMCNNTWFRFMEPTVHLDVRTMEFNISLHEYLGSKYYLSSMYWMRYMWYGVVRFHTWICFNRKSVSHEKNQHKIFIKKKTCTLYYWIISGCNIFLLTN